MDTNLKERIDIKIKEYIDNATANYVMYNLVLPVLAQWDGKKITKRLQTKLIAEISSDFHIYIQKDYTFVKLYMSRGSKSLQLYLCRIESDKVFKMEWFVKENSHCIAQFDRIAKYREGMTKVEVWVAEFEKMKKEIIDLKARMAEFGCEYVIDWSDIRYI